MTVLDSPPPVRTRGPPALITAPRFCRKSGPGEGVGEGAVRDGELPRAALHYRLSAQTLSIAVGSINL